MTFGGFKPLSANFTPTPNQFFDHCVVTVVAILIRSTLGWEDPVTGERRVEAELPLSAFVRPELCENSARKGLAMALTAGFIVQTARASNRDGARYALRWEDSDTQKMAIERARRSLQDPILGDPSRDVGSGGAKNGPPEIGPPEIGGPFFAPPYNKESKKDSFGKERKNLKKQTLNVGGDVNSVVSGGSEEGVFSRAFEAQAAGIAAELQDLGSERRHRQLLEVCDRHGLGDLVNQALQATRERMGKEKRRSVVEKPGAYYQSVLLKLLEDRQVFVPKAGEDDAGEVRRLIQESMGVEVNYPSINGRACPSRSNNCAEQ